MIVLYNVLWGFPMAEKMTVLNIRMSESEKEKIKEKADKIDLSVSAY